MVIAAPSDLNESEILHFAREEDLILAATAAARRAGKLRLEFAPSGQLEALEESLRDYRPHLLHFVGHGLFVDAEDRGLLLMEDRHRRKRRVWNPDFAEAVAQNGRDLRGVFLSACQSAVTARADGFVDLASYLLGQGIPVVVAMQHSVLNRSAMEFASVFYKGVAEGGPVEEALTEARRHLRRTSPNGVDFATPVLYLADPGCLRVSEVVQPDVSDTPLDLSGLTVAQNFVGRAVELSMLQTHLDPQGGRWRAAVIHGLGGMGKTVLAARLARRMAPRLDGVVSLRLTPATTAKQVLDTLGGFLLANNARFNHPAILRFHQINEQPLPLQTKVAALAEILRALRLLLIFDNCEDILPGGAPVSRAAQGAEAPAGQDPDLLPLIAGLVGSVDGPCRFVFTSRVDFSPVEENRLAEAIGHLPLKEMGFREAVYLMETLPPLDELPVAALDSPLSAREGPGVRALTKRDLYARLGGHPYRLSLFARHAGRSSVGQALDDLSGVDRELLEFTLLERAAAQLPERAARLVERAAVYEEAVPVEGLAFMLGDGRDAMPDVSAEVEALLAWGLAARKPGAENYTLHSLVRDWAKKRWKGEDEVNYLRRAAQYWQGVARDSHDLGDWLRARHYLFAAGEYEAADDIVQAATEPLERWGQWGLLLHLLRQSVETLKGTRKAVALGNLATIYQNFGDYATAMQFHLQAREVFEQSGDRRNVAASLHQIGNLHYLQGDYEQAREFYQRSLQILEEIGDRAGVATSLGQLGLLYAQTGRSEAAVHFLARARLLFASMGMPQARQALNDLKKLESALGAEGFAAALRTSGLPPEAQSALRAALGKHNDESQSQPDLRQVLVINTIALMTTSKDRRGEWWEALRRLHAQAREAGEAALAGYIDALLRLVEGAAPGTITPAVPEEYKEDWQTILNDL